MKWRKRSRKKRGGTGKEYGPAHCGRRQTSLGWHAYCGIYFPVGEHPTWVDASSADNPCGKCVRQMAAKGVL